MAIKINKQQVKRQDIVLEKILYIVENKIMMNASPFFYE